jgi:hypothetical protein
MPLFADAFHLGSEGRLTFVFGSSPSIRLDASFTVGWEGDNWGLGSVVKVEDGQWTELRWEGEAKPEGIDLGFTAIFDPQKHHVRFRPGGCRLLGKRAFHRRGGAAGKDGSRGRPLAHRGGGSPFRRIDLRFNLKRYRDEILEDTFSPGFSYATVTFEFPLAEGKSVGGKLLVDKAD